MWLSHSGLVVGAISLLANDVPTAMYEIPLLCDLVTVRGMK